MSRACVTLGVVTPNIDAASSGRSSAASTGAAVTMPAIAAAALAKMRRDSELRPATSTTLAARIRSLWPMIDRVSDAAIVETIIFGTPIGSARAAAEAIEVPPEPPIASRPSRRPSACSCAAITSAPRAMVVTALPRSPAAVSAATSAPTAAATSAAGMSGSITGGPAVPQSTRIVSTPAACRRSRTKPYSAPLLSRVPMRTTVGIGTP